MALRDVTTALDAHTLTEWRARLCTKVGVTYANLKSTMQTEVDRLINEAHDWVTKKYGHERWAQRVYTVGGSDFSAPSTSTGLFTLPASIRHVRLIQESENGTGYVGKIVLMTDWMAAGHGTTSHPWDQQTDPRYFFKAMSDGNPPVETWQRVPTPTSTFTAMTIVGNGYFTLLGTTGDTQYTELPPQVTEELFHRLAAKWFSYRNEYEKVGQEMELAREAMDATQINDGGAHGSDGSIIVGVPDEFDVEMS